jgi:phosphoribosylanthranilate isomerase
VTKIKICGLKSLNDIAIVNEMLPDYIGYVFAESKRQVDFETAKKMQEHLNHRIRSVGVFVNADPRFVLDLCEKNVIDAIQLHGDETEEYILNLKQKTEKQIIKAVRVQSTQQVLEAEQLPCDDLLLDTYQKGSYGGSGECFRWEMIPQLMKPFFLAGGLNEINLENAIRAVKPYCVDISSGAETDGKKDPNKIKRLIQIVRKEL